MHANAGGEDCSPSFNQKSVVIHNLPPCFGACLPFVVVRGYCPFRFHDA